MNRPPPVQWLRRHPFAHDSILAAVLLVVSMGAYWSGPHDDRTKAEPTVVGAIFVFFAIAPLMFRRRDPIRVLAVVATSQFVVEVTGHDGAGWLGVTIALYTVSAHTNGRPRDIVARVFAAATGVLFVVGFLRDETHIGELISSILFLTGAFVLGDNLQARRRTIAEQAERRNRLDRERELLGRQRVQDERSRIARELHDVVAHSVSLMIIQAGAARRSIATSPTQAENALRDLETTGRLAMDELRRVLGVLRAGDGDGDGLELAPQPSLGAVRDLIESDATLPIQLREVGTPPEIVPSTIGLSLYRVVQEALTNVRKHAGHVRHVEVQVAYEPDQVTVQITDDGRGASVATNVDGHGLVGMRERMALCGGTVTVGPRPGGGWQVRATAPLAEALA